jgi:hypothetical protein
VVTVTSAAAGERDLAAPAESYLRVMAAGLRESRNWSPARIGAYLAGIAGANGPGRPPRSRRSPRRWTAAVRWQRERGIAGGDCAVRGPLSRMTDSEPSILGAQWKVDPSRPAR